MRRAWLALLLAPWLAHASSARAAEPTAADTAAARAQDDAWASRLTEAKAQRDDALRRVIAGEAALSTARHRHHPRGDALAALEKDLERARADLAKADERLPELLEQARRAGVSPALLQEFEEDEPEAP